MPSTPNRFTDKIAEEKKPFLQRRSTRIGAGVVAGIGTGLLVDHMTGHRLAAGWAGRSRKHMSKLMAYGDALEAEGVYQHGNPQARIEYVRKADRHIRPLYEAARKSWNQKRNTVRAGLVGGGAAAGGFGTDQAIRRHEKRASVTVPGTLGTAILPRDLTRYMSDDDAARVKKYAPHRRIEAGLAARVGLAGASAFGKGVAARMRDNEPLRVAAKYTGEDIGYGLRDFMTKQDLSFADAHEDLQMALPVLAPLMIGSAEGFKRLRSKSHGRNQTARKAVRAVSSARFYEGALQGRNLRELLREGRDLRRTAHAGILTTPAGQSVGVA